MVVKRQRFALFYPGGFLHLERTCNVFRYLLIMSLAFAIFFSKPGS
jgi:hypothetical protein